jgi:type II secretory pathway pseudopilin PulG
MTPRKIIAILSALLCVSLLGLALSTTLPHKTDQQRESFIQQARTIIKALQNYRQTLGQFPQGDASKILAALSGKQATNPTDPKILLITEFQFRKNDQGQVLDPWDTPLQIFLSEQTILIRSAGPNQSFEDSSDPKSDDLFLSDAR